LTGAEPGNTLRAAHVSLEMTNSHIGAYAPTPLRLWPGVVLVALQWFARFALPVILPDALYVSVFAGVLGGLAILAWWMFFSRVPSAERWGVVLLIVAVIAATPLILDRSVASGMMGMMFYIYALPTLSLALVAGAALGRGFAAGPRLAVMATAIVIGCAGWALVRTGGFTGDLDHDFAWRWADTPEERLLAQAANEPEPVPPPASAVVVVPDAPLPDQPVDAPAALPSSPAAAAAAEPAAAWPGFRGADRDSVVHGARIDTNWSASPPVELWRRPIGPGWSSFAVRGDIFYTQEQRGDDEIVAAYHLTTGAPVWKHRDAARFWESNGGPGPRGTPTLSNGRVYTLGATGILNVLEAHTGAVAWSRNAAADTGATLPDWGFASSPIVVDDLVIVAASSTLAAYDAATGQPRWTRPGRGTSYSSPHLATIDGIRQIVLLSGRGAVGVAPADGTLLWEHAWPGTPIVQPAMMPDGNILVSSGDNSGMRRLAVAHGPAGWSVAERWASNGLKPYFNDFVVHEGHVFGFDGGILASIGLDDGTRRWKGGRYGYGQLLLLPDQDLLLVLSEEGELALVGATPDQFRELARVPAIAGKTWNHPVLVGNVLLVRNGEEMVAFRLTLSTS